GGPRGGRGAGWGRAPARRRAGVGPPSPRSVLAPPSPTPSVGFAPGTCPGAWEDLEGMLWTDRPAAALPPSYPLTETACGRDLAVLISRRGGTDEFLGRGGVPRSRAPGNGGPADPWKSVWCSRVLTPLVEPVRRSRVRVESRAVPVVTHWGETKVAPCIVRTLTEEAIRGFDALGRDAERRDDQPSLLPLHHRDFGQ